MRPSLERDVVLRTTRLVVTTWLPEDLDDLYRLHSDPVTMRFIGGRTETRAESASRLERYLSEQAARGWTRWRVASSSGSFVGRAGFGDFQDDRELGYTLSRRSWGRGLATEAATALVGWHDLHPAPRTSDRGGAMDLWGYADVDNVASVRVLAVAGLSFVETRPAYGTTCAFFLRVPPGGGAAGDHPIAENAYGATTFVDPGS